MLKRKSMKQLFVAAYLLILFLPCKCFPHRSVKGWGYTGNPYSHDNPRSIALGQVDIEFDFDEDDKLTFFQISMLDRSSNDQVVLVENSPALLQALNQAIHFETGVNSIEDALPAISFPQLKNGAPDFTNLSIIDMGSMTGASCKEEGDLRHRKYYKGSEKLLGILSAAKDRWSEGPIKNLIAFSFANKAFYVLIKTIYFQSFFEEGMAGGFKDRDHDHDHDHDQDTSGAGGATGVSINTLRKVNSTSQESFFLSKELLWMLNHPEDNTLKIETYLLLRKI